MIQDILLQNTGGVIFLLWKIQGSSMQKRTSRQCQGIREIGYNLTQRPLDNMVLCFNKKESFLLSFFHKYTYNKTLTSMISFDKFVLSPKQIDELRRAHAKLEIKKYIKEHGAEPADITDFFTYTEAEYDKYKRVLYANSVVSSVEELPFQPVKPEEIENTPEQDETASAIANAVDNAQSSYTAGENETINNVTIPESATKAMTINGPVQNGATIGNESTKGVTVNNTSEDPISITVSNTSSTASYTLKGDAGYNDIYAESNKITVSAPVNGTIV